MHGDGANQKKYEIVFKVGIFLALVRYQMA
jgi:hypothetical protein